VLGHNRLKYFRVNSRIADDAMASACNCWLFAAVSGESSQRSEYLDWKGHADLDCAGAEHDGTSDVQVDGR
jgi:hypothetical protein